MKPLKKYIQKREDTISLLLKKPQNKFTSETFHKLRVEIKKLNALFDLIHHCSNNFSRNKNYKPFKSLFHYAGRIRELQLEERIINKYSKGKTLNNFKKVLSDKYKTDVSNFFKRSDKKLIDNFSKRIQKASHYSKKIKENKVSHYLQRKKNSIKKLLHQKHIQSSHLHELRKSLKMYYYNQKSLDQEKKNKSKSKKDILPDLLGKWHDCQATIRQMNSAMKSTKLKSKEITELKKIKNKVSDEREMLIKKINSILPSYKLQ